jgi:uncharacterized Zn-binding protein involved in type VI secretion
MTLAGAVGMLASCQTMMMGGEEVSLTGAAELPTVATTASGSGNVTIKGIPAARSARNSRAADRLIARSSAGSSGG